MPPLEIYRTFKNVKIPVLTYHSIEESGSIISTSPETFRRQIKILSENDYCVLPLGKIIENLIAGEPVSPKTIALTFDDGFQNFYSTAFPILAEHGFPATVFLVTEFCGKFNDWSGNPPDLPRSPLLSWHEIKELQAYGIEFGAHSQTHPDLTAIPTAEAEWEIIGSKLVIEDMLGEKVNIFAYPYGKFDSSVKAVAEKNYRAACSVKLGKICPASNLFTLERIDSYYLSSPRVFNSLASKSFDRYLQFRQSLRDLKSFLRRH
jgi:peptidoglycan/xylan/chitin deacetylase (PgdA/CDA1 family)